MSRGLFLFIYSSGFGGAEQLGVAAEGQRGGTNLASVALGGLEAAVAQAAVGCGRTAGDDLQLFLGAVRPVQQLLDELLQPHFGVGFARRRLLEELVNLSNLPANRHPRNVLWLYHMISLGHTNQKLITD